MKCKCMHCKKAYENNRDYKTSICKKCHLGYKKRFELEESKRYVKHRDLLPVESVICPKCATVIKNKRLINNNKGDWVYVCVECDDQISHSAVRNITK